MQQTSLIDWVQSLFQIGQSLAVESSAQVRQRLLEHIVTGFGAASGSIALVNSDGGALTLAAGTGSAANFLGTQIALGDGVLGWVAQERLPLLLTGDISNDARFKNLKLRRNPDRPLSALCWPLQVDNHVIGALSINRPVGAAAFTQQDVADGAVMIGLVSLVVDNLLTHDRQREHEAALLKEQDEQRALIQKLQEAQGQLLQSEKMASVGQLAAGVAHEINNPVGYVFSNLGTLQKYIAGLLQIIQAYEQNIEPLVAPDASVLKALFALKTQTDLSFVRADAPGLMSESMEGLVRVKKIVQDLKDFSHVDKAEWQWADLHKGLDSTLNIVHNEIKYKATVVKDYGKVPEVECIASQVNQVFMNMLVNAVHAIEERGTITIRTGIEGEQVWVEIADSGKGIAPEHLQKIFEPFFTTKPVGKGTGLGLSLAYGIIHKHGGRIEVQSEVGKGTAFRVWLPVRQPQAKAA